VPKRRSQTWADLGWKNAGIRKTSRALKFAMGWGLATATLGREPATVEEYAQVMQESRATAFRDQQAFREAFPEEESPARMNRASGTQDRYDELWQMLHDRKKLALAAQPEMYRVGGSPTIA
jgi:hypothetical protein